jgi:hypothetical protein
MTHSNRVKEAVLQCIRFEKLHGVLLKNKEGARVFTYKRSKEHDSFCKEVATKEGFPEEFLKDGEEYLYFEDFYETKL